MTIEEVISLVSNEIRNSAKDNKTTCVVLKFELELAQGGVRGEPKCRREYPLKIKT